MTMNSSSESPPNEELIARKTVECYSDFRYVGSSLEKTLGLEDTEKAYCGLAPIS